ARIGAVSIPLSTFSTGTELVGLLRGADVTLLLATEQCRSNDFVSSLGAAIPELPSTEVPSLRGVVFDPDGLEGLVNEDVLAAAEAAVTPADRMVIVHTSGSTSAPKGVVHTHGALIEHLDNL